jgi:hypothetical protein
MADAPVLKLKLLDAFDDPIVESAIVMLRNQMTGTLISARSEGGKILNIKGLTGFPQGLYRVEVDPAGYLASGTFVNVEASGVTEATLHFAVDSTRVTKVDFPAFKKLDSSVQHLLDGSSVVTGFEGISGATLYDRLDDIRRAGFLNITTKCRATTLPNSRTVLSYIQELRDLRGDRFFCSIPQTLRDDVKNAAQAGMFNEVNGSLHHPPDGFTPAGSFKSEDHYGNLQLTFFASPGSWVADIDIDDANGLAHVFQVLRNELTGRPTHPYDIHEILMLFQQLDTGYRFEL